MKLHNGNALRDMYKYASTAVIVVTDIVTTITKTGMPSRNYNIKHMTCGVMPFVITFTFYKHRFSCVPLI
jgi:hypothetical protein